MRKNIFILLLLIPLFLFTNQESFADIENWQKKTSEHFIIYYQDQNVTEEFLNKVISCAENYYDKIANNLGFTRYNFWLWENRAKIHIYGDQKSYMQDTKQPSWSMGATFYRDKTIKTYPLAIGFFDSLLPHELGHIIFREFVGFKNNIPLWLDEGVATYQEEAKRWGSKHLAKEALGNNKFIPLKELTEFESNTLNMTNNADLVNLFYAESVSIVDFLVTRFGNASFSSFCRSLRDGKSLEEAISENYPYKNLDELNWSWEYYLKNN